MMDEFETSQALKASAQGVRARVRRALKNAGLSQSEVSRRAQELTPKAIRQLLSNAFLRGARPRDEEVRNAFAAALGVKPQWLWFGVRSAADRGGGAFLESDKDVVPDQGKSDSPVGPDSAHLPLRPDPHGYLIQVVDRAWEPFARPGDYLLVSPSHSPTRGALVYVATPSMSGPYRLSGFLDDYVALISPTGMPVSLPLDSTMVHRISAIICS